MMQLFKIVACPNCGRQFQRLGRFGKFCSPKCRRAFYVARRKARASAADSRPTVRRQRFTPRGGGR
jgi:protein-arginine kinase activator protein McsA